MDGGAFDDLTKQLAGATSRRGLLRALGRGLVGVVAGGAAARREAAAQDGLRLDILACLGLTPQLAAQVCIALNLPNVAKTGCVNGRCAILACKPGWGNCDGQVQTGCETPLNTLANCGACGAACALPHATATCETGQCKIAACDAGFANCDGIDTNGCEIDTQTDPNHCGACATACSLPHATAMCVSGQCAIAACDDGWGDCDGVAANGCETPLDTLTDCGTCGVACSFPNADATCAGGACQLASCNPGFGDCDNSPANGCETPLSTLTNCGACGVACTPGLNVASVACATGQCAIATCNPGFGDCDGNPANGCETPLNTLTDCGACGHRCGPKETCDGGTCKCGDGPACERRGFCDPHSDPPVCRCRTGEVCGIGHYCSGPVTCCLEGWMACNGVCIDWKNDPRNCGYCGINCGVDATCSGGVCTCSGAGIDVTCAPLERCEFGGCVSACVGKACEDILADPAWTGRCC